MNEFINSLVSQLESFPVWGIILFCFVSACIQQVFPPYPSEVLLLILGGLAATNVINGPASIIPYVIGTVVSSIAVFYISRRVGKPVLKNKYVRKIFPRRYQRRAGVYLHKYGTAALAICKFLPGINTVCLIIAGVMGIRGISSIITIAVAGIVENIVYFLAGMAIGNSMTSIYDFSKQLSIILAIAAAVIIALIILIKNRSKLFKKPRSNQ